MIPQYGYNMLRCAKYQNCTRTCGTHDLITAGIPVPVTNPTYLMWLEFFLAIMGNLFVYVCFSRVCGNDYVIQTRRDLVKQGDGTD
jgi:hypothetical protein